MWKEWEEGEKDKENEGNTQEEEGTQNSTRKRRRRLVRQDKYNARVKSINKSLREEDQLLVNYMDIVLSEDKLKVGWCGKNFVPDRQHIN